MTRIVFAALCALALVSYASARPAVASVPAHCVGCDFSHSDQHGKDFEGVSYVGADFSGANLQHADFRNAKLVGADFKDADLTGADLSNANLIGVALRGAKLAGANLTNVKATGVDVRGVGEGLTDAQLRGLFGHCTGCDAAGANVSGRDLSGVKMVGADMRNANAGRTRFTNADLVGVAFQNADLHDSDFGGAAVCWYNGDYRSDGSYGSYTRSDPQCLDLAGANVSGADFRTAKICSGDRERKCSTVDASMLRKLSHSSLAGALLP